MSALRTPLGSPELPLAAFIVPSLTVLLVPSLFGTLLAQFNVAALSQSGYGEAIKNTSGYSVISTLSVLLVFSPLGAWFGLALGPIIARKTLARGVGGWLMAILIGISLGCICLLLGPLIGVNLFDEMAQTQTPVSREALFLGICGMLGLIYRGVLAWQNPECFGGHAKRTFRP